MVITALPQLWVMVIRHSSEAQLSAQKELGCVKEELQQERDRQVDLADKWDEGREDEMRSWNCFYGWEWVRKRVYIRVVLNSSFWDSVTWNTWCQCFGGAGKGGTAPRCHS